MSRRALCGQGSSPLVLSMAKKACNKFFDRNRKDRKKRRRFFASGSDEVRMRYSGPTRNIRMNRESVSDIECLRRAQHHCLGSYIQDGGRWFPFHQVLSIPRNTHRIRCEG